MIACCGLDCSQCGAYQATQANDDTKRAAVAKEWSERYNVDVRPDQITCNGCRSDGQKFYYCSDLCARAVSRWACPTVPYAVCLPVINSKVFLSWHRRHVWPSKRCALSPYALSPCTSSKSASTTSSSFSFSFLPLAFSPPDADCASD